MAGEPRTFKLQSPHMTGDDVGAFQRDLQARFDAWTINITVADDSDYGDATKEAAQRVCIALGILHEQAMKGGVTPELRTKIRHPHKRTPQELTRSETAEAKAYRAKLRKKFEGAGQLFDGHAVAPWIIPSLKWAREHGWKGTVTSGYRSCEHQKEVAAQFAKEKGVTVAQMYPNGPCASNHVGLKHPRGAVDVSNAAQLNDVLRNNPHTPGLTWGGPVINDQVHFSATGH